MRFKGGKRKRELEAAIERGRELRSIGSQEAASFLEDAARRFPESAEFPLLLATVYLGSRPDDVATQVAKAVELGSDDPATQVRAGHMLLNEEKIEAARACAARADDLVGGEFPLMAGLEALRRRIASQDGEYAVAEEWFRSALRSGTEVDNSVRFLTLFLRGRGRNEEALALIDESLARAKLPDGLERLRREIAAEC
jgi:tetratricopeptide (TPR) repeat protein